jgi:hypothetical protein
MLCGSIWRASKLNSLIGESHLVQPYSVFIPPIALQAVLSLLNIVMIEGIDRMTRYRSKKVLTVAFMLGCCSFMKHSTTLSYDPFVVGALTIEESSIQHTITTAEYIQDKKLSLADDLSHQIMVNMIDRLNCVIESILNTGATAVDTIDEFYYRELGNSGYNISNLTTTNM